MLERQEGPGKIVYYVSPLLSAIGAPHAFSTRLGGDSPAPFDSLNLGNPNGCDQQDDYPRIWRNYAKLLAAIGSPTDPPLRVHQVHGNVVMSARRGEAFDTSAKADSIVSDDLTRPISVRVADCVPVLLSTGNGRAVAAIHAGWRGIIAGAIPAALQRLTRIAGEKSEDVVAAIGPCIGYDAFEVGPEVVAEFSRAFGPSAPVHLCPDGKGRVDLRAAARLQLLEERVAPEKIDSTDRCTFSHSQEFFSHRREHGVTGRMAAIIAPSPR